MQEIKFVQTQRTANDPIWAPIKGNKDFSSTAVTPGWELLLPMKSNQILIKNTSYTKGTGEREGQEKHVGISIHLAQAKTDL